MAIFDAAEFYRIKAKYWDPSKRPKKFFYKDPKHCVRTQTGIVVNNKILIVWAG